ncbi:hypothetical protein ES288_A03G167500v1 [Gossypium darwinii]|uniref:Uncharacterized protein n=2 Tax=Gossypium TaxID=3633 RepID=A0A5D2R8L7_GOSTO|nr:hypothetical protein ES288_A03G167500v1 [Gossypium darwinii]TYI36752.1 hypothetical protein ES332_A03G163300v1 [Gossypium tomentosum]
MFIWELLKSSPAICNGDGSSFGDSNVCSTVASFSMAVM